MGVGEGAGAVVAARFGAPVGVGGNGVDVGMGVDECVGGNGIGVAAAGRSDVAGAAASTGELIGVDCAAMSSGAAVGVASG